MHYRKEAQKQIFVMLLKGSVPLSRELSSPTAIRSAAFRHHLEIRHLKNSAVNLQVLDSKACPYPSEAAAPMQLMTAKH